MGTGGLGRGLSPCWAVVLAPLSLYDLIWAEGMWNARRFVSNIHAVCSGEGEIDVLYIFIRKRWKRDTSESRAGYYSSNLIFADDHSEM